MEIKDGVVKFEIAKLIDVPGELRALGAYVGGNHFRDNKHIEESLYLLSNIVSECIYENCLKVPTTYDLYGVSKDLIYLFQREQNIKELDENKKRW